MTKLRSEFHEMKSVSTQDIKTAGSSITTKAPSPI
jgi:hypothetical protein